MFEVETWEVVCGDCGFRSGFGRAWDAKTRTGILFSGAGCRERRDLKAVKQKLADWMKAHQSNP